MGFLGVKILETKYQVNLEFPRGRASGKQKTFHGGSIDILLEIHNKLVHNNGKFIL